MSTRAPATHPVLPVDSTGSTMNTATLPPWLAWSNGLVYGQRVFPGDAERFRPLERARHRPRLTIYTYAHDNQPIIRFSSWSEGSGGGGGGGGAAGDAASPAPAGGAAGGVALSAVRWQRVPLDHDPWHVDVPVPVQPPGLDAPGRYDHSDVDYSPPLPAAEGLAAWGGVLRGWAAGATLLALLVVIARAAEKCLDWKFLRRRRRLHQEWQRRNGYPDTEGRVSFPGLDNEHPLPADLTDMCTVDLPPPYSECTPPRAAADAPKADDHNEEPPPPYSDAFVHFVNKNGVPVLVYSRTPPVADCVVVADDPGQAQVGRILEACGIRVTRNAPDASDGDPLPTSGVGPIENTVTNGGAECNENSAFSNSPDPNIAMNAENIENETTEAMNPNIDTIDVSVTDENETNIGAKQSDAALKNTDDDDPPRGSVIV